MKKIILLFIAAAGSFIIACAQTDCRNILLSPATTVNLTSCGDTLQAFVNPTLQRASLTDVTDINNLYGASGFAIQGKVYVVLSNDGTDPANTTSATWQYDPGTDTWMQVADFGGAARNNAAAFNVKDTGYITMGNDPSTGAFSDMWAYDLTNTWRPRADFIGGPDGERTSFSIDNSAYIVQYGVVFAYDAGADTWVQKNAAFSGDPVAGGTAFSIGSKGYWGIGISGTTSGPLNDFYEYDPVADKWTKKAEFPGGGRIYAAGFGISGKGYVGMGIEFASGENTDMWVYDPTTDKWARTADYSGTPTVSPAIVNTGTSAYICFGQNYDDNSQLNELWQFTPGDNSYYDAYAWTLNGSPLPDVTSYVVATATGTYGVTGTKTACADVTATVDVAGAPTVDNFDPTTAAAGDIITITGSNFYSINTVLVGGAPAQFNIDDPATIEASPTYGAGNDSIGLVTGCDTLWVTGFTFSCNTGDWNGHIDSNWQNASNWCGGVVPDQTQDVYIGTGANNYPLIKDLASVNTLFVDLGTTLKVASGGQLNIYQDFENYNDPDVLPVDAYNGAVSFVGTNPQNLDGDLDVGTLTINNTAGVTINSINYGSTWVYKIYNPTSGVLYTDDDALVLASGPDGTATVTTNTSGSEYIFGKIEYQRYLSARRAWRMLTVPLSNTGTIFDNWQNGGTACGCGGTGIEMFNPYGTNGFDPNPVPGAGSASVRLYDEQANNWVDLDNTGQPLSYDFAQPANRAYAVFSTGPYGSNHIRSGGAATVAIAAGYLQQGEQIFTYQANDPVNFPLTYMLTGNPYAAPVDLSKVATTNTNNTFWIWDPNRQSTSLGGYVAFSQDPIDPTQWDQDLLAPETAQTINVQSGQAFFVQAQDGTQPVTITFEETNKTTDTTGAVFFAPTPSAAQQLRITLNRSVNSNMQPVDGVLAKFGGNYKKNVSDDAAKFFNYDENLSIRIDTSYLGISRTPVPAIGDTMWLNVYALKNKASYSFTVLPQNLSMPGVAAWLVDRYLKTHTAISLTQATTVEFATDGQKASYDGNRFYVLFAKEGALARVITNVKAWSTDKGIQVEWSTATEQGVKQYQVEKSTDGQQFTTVSSALPKNTGGTVTYNWIDEQPAVGNNYYRIKLLTNDVEAQYSNIALVTLQKGKPVFSAYPNPVSHKQPLQIQLANVNAGTYTVQLFSMEGKKLLQKTIAANGAARQTLTITSAGLAAASYRVVLIGKDGVIWQQQVIVQ